MCRQVLLCFLLLPSRGLWLRTERRNSKAVERVFPLSSRLRALNVNVKPGNGYNVCKLALTIKSFYLRNCFRYPTSSFAKEGSVTLCSTWHSEQLAVVVGRKIKLWPNAMQTSSFDSLITVANCFAETPFAFEFGVFVKPPASRLTISLPLSAYLSGQTICPFGLKVLWKQCKQTNNRKWMQSDPRQGEFQRNVFISGAAAEKVLFKKK